MTAPESFDDVRTANLMQLSLDYFAATQAPAASRMLSDARRSSGQFTGPDATTSSYMGPVGNDFRLEGPPAGFTPPPKPVDLRHLLRFHRPEPVNSEQVVLRDAFDELLEYYSLLEIGCLARMVPDDFSADARRHVVLELGDPALQRYYTEHYPLLLPRLFLRRMKDGKGLEIPLPDDVASRYAEFLDLNALLRKDADVDTFLWFLDEGWLGPYNIQSVLEVLRDPVKLVEHLVHDGGDADGEDGPVERAVRGFRTFLGFCVDFDSFLQNAAKYPELASAFWHYHGYWFRNMKDLVGPLMHQAVDCLMSWNAGLAKELADESDHGLIETQARELHARIGRLTSDVYARPLERLA